MNPSGANSITDPSASAVFTGLHRDTTGRTRPGLDHDRLRIIVHMAGNEPCQGVLQPGREARQYTARLLGAAVQLPCGARPAAASAIPAADTVNKSRRVSMDLSPLETVRVFRISCSIGCTTAGTG